ncbi:MAG TPA: DUF6519 domain-containing protein [Longimicrobium sp.]|nr:DUF6519 domain-containing protein [Longimicrobium sp.]
MKGDFSRQTFDPARHFSGVRMQQGRVQLDADWNEQVDLSRHRVETETADTVGHCGGPLHDAGFRIVPLADAPQGVKDALQAADPDLDPDTTDDLVILPGRYYVDGVLAVCEAPVLFGRQPDLPPELPLNAPNPAHGLQPGDYVLYLDVWDRHVTALENPALRERALGGPDTTTRTRTVWQVRSVAYTPDTEDGNKPEPCAPASEYDDAIAQAVRTLRARSQPAGPDQGPCVVPAGAGYRGLENQLYRVEIHGEGAADAAGGADAAVSGVDPQDARMLLVPSGGGWAVGQTVVLYPTTGGSTLRPVVAQVAAVQEPGIAADPAKVTLSAPFTLNVADDAPHLRRVAGATFKWSRDNGIAVAGVSAVSADGLRVTVDSLGQDEVLGFRMGDWVELTDDFTELRGRPGWLAVVDRLDTAEGEVVLRTPFPALALDALDFDNRTPKLRRWDGIGIVGAGAQAGGYHALEDGVEVRFDGGPFRTGDYWLIPARAATAEDEGGGNVEWPAESATQGAPRPPAGIRHHYCRLGTVNVGDDGGGLTVQDCRCLFPPLTEVRALSYVGGAGQEAMPLWAEADPRPELGLPLVVGVGNGHCRTDGRVVFRAREDSGDVTAVSGMYPNAGRKQLEVEIGADGMARCWWRLATDAQHQVVVATLQERVAQDPDHPDDDTWIEVPGPVIFNASLSVASEVAYRPDADCRMSQAQPPVATVQEALDWLCARTGGCSSLTVSPGDGWYDQVTAFLERNTGRDVDICFRAGRYPLERPLVVRGFRNVSLHGVGPATRFEAAELERALYFEDCAHVAVRGFFAATGVTARADKGGEPPNGTLAFVECRAVVAEELVLQCAGGIRRDAACLVAMNPDSPQRRVPDTSITIRGCEAQVGDRQIGILLVNPGNATVDGNHVHVHGRLAEEVDFDEVMAQRGFVTYLDTILTGVRGPLELPLPDEREADGSPVTWYQYLGPWWRRWHDAQMGKTSASDLRDALSDYVESRQGVPFTKRVDGALPSGEQPAGRLSGTAPAAEPGELVIVVPGGEQVVVGTTVLRRWVMRLLTVGSQGIVVGGGVAGDVTVNGNRIEGVLQGVHIGLSHHRPRQHEDIQDFRRGPDSVHRAVVSANDILVHVPFGRGGLARHGIFVGNCHSVLIHENRAASSDAGLHPVRMRDPESGARDHYLSQRGADGIRAYGYYGPMLLIRENHLEDFTIGVFVSVLNAPAGLPDSTKMPVRRRLWRVAHNVAAHAFEAVMVDSGFAHVEQDGNVLAD